MTARISRYCACGGSLVGHIAPDRLAPVLGAIWDKTHNSPECAPATPTEASNARRRAKRAEARG